MPANAVCMYVHKMEVEKKKEKKKVQKISKRRPRKVQLNQINSEPLSGVRLGGGGGVEEETLDLIHTHTLHTRQDVKQQRGTVSFLPAWHGGQLGGGAGAAEGPR